MSWDARAAERAELHSPDPEPTNAEKLADELKRALPNTGETIEWEEVARRLDDAGVRVVTESE